ncbi:RHS repeat-associated core domain-containing protein [Paenibacillus pini]|uniref:Uncharacterized protein n=1 Tax=Paenibacillus pini JCM 16418 TaxID=1236976 RepID=W7YMC6_9BACL|nr:hypothetical protein [Paenibacillus pini]GAF08763.1 hypothetical protein JCM16418_2868 [Paenibacillus pini JCM 16418]
MFKKVFSLVVACSLLFGSIIAEAAPTENKNQSYALEWGGNEGGSMISKIKVGELEYNYTYNDKGNRIAKTFENKNILYDYNNDSLLSSEVRENNYITYNYNSTNDMIGLTLNGEIYNFVKDDDLNVTAIMDIHNFEVAKYSYSENGIASILGRDENGEWIDKSDDPSFIGSINLIRLHSFYYDTETKLYYNGFHYYDSTINQYVVNENINKITPKASSDVINKVSSCESTSKNNSNFGKSISYSSTWYNNLSDVELLTRLFYGENTVNKDDQNAVTWVIINRKIKNTSTFGGGTFRGVATKSGAFEPITGAESGTANARVPSTSSSLWNNALYNACVLTVTSSTADYNDLIQKPTGISTQLYFVGLSYFLTGVSQDITPIGSGIKYSFNGGSSFVPIKDIVIVFNYTSTFQNPTSRSAITSNSNLNTAAKRNTHNIFFNES